MENAFQGRQKRAVHVTMEDFLLDSVSNAGSWILVKAMPNQGAPKIGHAYLLGLACITLATWA